MYVADGKTFGYGYNVRDWAILSQAYSFITTIIHNNNNNNKREEGATTVRR